MLLDRWKWYTLRPVVTPDSVYVNTDKNLVPKIVRASVTDIVINGTSTLGDTYNFEHGDSLSCVISIHNDGNVPIESYMDIWSTEFGITPEETTTAAVGIGVGGTGQVSFPLYMEDGYIDGTKDVDYRLIAFDPERVLGAPSQDDFSEYPQRAYQTFSTFTLSKWFKKAIFGEIDFDRLIYEPGEDLNVALKLRNVGTHDATFDVTVLISDLPSVEGEMGSIQFEQTQNNILLSSGQEKTLNRVSWTIPGGWESQACYLFATVTSASATEVIEYDKTIGVFHVKSIPGAVEETSEHYRPTGGVAEVVPVSVEGETLYGIIYYNIASEYLHFDGLQYWSGGYEKIEYMVVTNNEGVASRQESELFRKALFTTIAYEVFRNADVYWTEEIKKIEKLWKETHEEYCNHAELFTGQIDSLEHRRRLAQIGKFFAGLGQSIVTGPAIAGKTIAELAFKETFWGYVVPHAANEVFLHTGGTTAAFGDPGAWSPEYGIPNVQGTEIQEDRELILLTCFVLFTVADLVFEYVDDQAQAELGDLAVFQALIMPPLWRAQQYFMDNGGSDAWHIGREIGRKAMEFRKEGPTYANIVDCLGWGIDDPFGITTGDNSTAYFQYYIMA